MRVITDSLGTLDSLAAHLRELDAAPDVAGIVVLACDDNGFAPGGVDPLLQSLGKPTMGGIFPQVIFDGRNQTRGTILIGLPVAPQIAIIRGMSDTSARFEDALEAQLFSDSAPRTLFLWVDGLSSRIGALIAAVFSIYGLEHNYIGGGAGSLSFTHKPSVFTNEGLLADAAVLASAPLRSGVGVAHGWTALSEPLIVTAAEGNVIKQLNYLPAYDVYREVVESSTDLRFDSADFFDLAKSHPFGILRLDAEYIVRDPVDTTHGGGLVCVGEVPVRSHVRVLTGSTASLVAAAGAAAHTANASYPADASAVPTLTLFIDCISRVLFLRDDFGQEMLAVAGHGQPVIGALTLGEIANSGADYLAFLNKTAVVAVLG